MPEIVFTIAVSTFVLFAVIIAGTYTVHSRRAGRRERELFIRWAAFSALFGLALASWTVTGISAFLIGTEFWRGVWVGGSAVLWVGYVPALVWVARAGHRQGAAARVLDMDG